MFNSPENALAIIADEYAKYESSKGELYSWSEIAGVYDKSFEFDEQLIKLNKENKLTQVMLEPLHPSEYVYYAVRNQADGFNLHLLDEDHLHVLHVEGVPEGGIRDAVTVLALRYFLFSDGRISPSTSRYNFTPENDEFSDEAVFLTFGEYEHKLMNEELSYQERRSLVQEVRDFLKSGQF